MSPMAMYETANRLEEFALSVQLSSFLIPTI